MASENWNVPSGQSPSTGGQREREIIRYLREVSDKGEDGATASEVYNAVSSRIGDSRTIQTYYKTLARLEVTQRVLSLQGTDDQSPRRYQLARGISLSHAFTLDDIRDAVLYRRPAAIMAAMEHESQYLEHDRNSTLRKAARELLKETDPPALIAAMLDEDIRVLVAKFDEYQEARDPGLWAMIEDDYHRIERLYLRELGLTHRALTLPLLTSLESAYGQIQYDAKLAHEEIKAHVYGRACIWPASVSEETLDVTVAGTDASVRFSQVHFVKAPAFQDEEGGHVSVNSSVAVERLAEGLAIAKGRRELFHSLPLTKEAIDDPRNRGMIMLRIAYPDLTDSEFEHAKKSATDVVQWRVDAAVFTGTAPDTQTSEMLPRPAVHLRDGTVVPQEREHKHYIRNDAYGEFTREALRYTRRVIQDVRESGSRRVFGGTVKSTQSRLFGSFVSWYIRSGSRMRLGQPIDPQWELARTPFIPDHIYMTHLFGALGAEGLFCTFVVTRDFHSTTEYFQSTKRVEDAGGWAAFIGLEREGRRQRKTSTGEAPDWDEGVDLEDDDFVYVCNHVRYASFYLGTTGGEPAPLIPRYEFMLPIAPQEETAQIVSESQGRLIRAVMALGFQFDRDHNMLTGRRLTRVLPYVVYRAHEMSKDFGGLLERVLHSAVASLLSRREGRRIIGSDVRLEPADPSATVKAILAAADSETDEDLDRDSNTDNG